MSQIPPPTIPPSTPPPSGGGAYTPPPPPPSGGAAPGGSDRTLMVALSYLWILALIPLLAKKDDREVQWHARNGLALLVAEVAVWLVLWLVSMFMPFDFGCGIATIQCVAWIGFLVLRIICIVKGVAGQRYRIPMVSDFADKM